MRGCVLLLIWPLVFLPYGSDAMEGVPQGFLEMEVREVMVDPDSESPVVILENERESVALPIWIGVNEAIAISVEMQEAELPRPLTHDLLRNVILGLGATMSQVRVTALKDNTFYASISIVSQGKSIEIDSRPSDAIALALRLHAPILVDRSVLETAGWYEQSFRESSNDAFRNYGISVQGIDSELARLFRVSSDLGRGVLVSDVTPDGTASRDGLKRGDVILAVDSLPVQSVKEFEGALSKTLMEDRSFALEVIRNGRQIHLTHSPQ